MNVQSTITHKQIPRDQSRRYLVVGDLHGRFATLGDLLQEARYDPLKDILLSVGDLIDRGPCSVELVDFFTARDRHVVRGNHEHMVLDLKNWREVWDDPYNGGPATRRSLQSAGRDINWLVEKVATYPVCLDVGDNNDSNAFRLVHAEQPFDWSEQEFCAFLKTSSFIEAGEGRLLWGRDDVENVEEGLFSALHANRSTRRCFCGHTPVEQIIDAHDTHWIDTFVAGTLSCIDAITLDAWAVPVRDNEKP